MRKIPKRQHHEITYEELHQFVVEEEVLFARSSRENKSLYVKVGNSNIRVVVGGETVYHGTQPYSAVEAYNAITEKYVNPLNDFKI